MGHLLAGLVFVALGVWGMIAWWDSFGLVTRGLAPFAALALGLVAILSGLFRSPRVEERAHGGREVASEPLHDQPAAGPEEKVSPERRPLRERAARAGREPVTVDDDRRHRADKRPAARA